MSPGASATYMSESGEYRIGWVGPQPTVGSVRRFIEVRGLERGDWLYLAPRDNQLRLFAIRSVDLIGLSNPESLFKQTCPSATHINGNLQAAIAASIGLSSLHFRKRERLRMGRSIGGANCKRAQLTKVQRRFVVCVARKIKKR
jgi:hypothetical protein